LKRNWITFINKSNEKAIIKFLKIVQLVQGFIIVNIMTKILMFKIICGAGGVAQVLEHLPCKPEALTSSSSANKKKRKKRKKDYL
jgi:hypothetical protein